MNYNARDYERHLLDQEVGEERRLQCQQEEEKRMRLELSYIELVGGKELLNDIEGAILDLIREQRASGAMDMIEEGLFTATEELRAELDAQLDKLDY